MSDPLSPTGFPTTPAPPVNVPMRWLLEHAAPPIQYRALIELEALPAAPADVPLDLLPYTHPQAVRLVVGHAWDGSGPGGMLGVPRTKGAVESAGTMLAVRRLLEYGWTHDAPPLHRARRALFRLLAEDSDPNFLYDLAAEAGSDEAMITRGRRILRGAAGATLAQAGYAEDPRLRGAAHRATTRACYYLASALAENPWVKARDSVALDEEAAPPSMYLLVMLAHMPLFRTEHQTQMEQLFEHVSKPRPPHACRQWVGTRVVEQSHLVLGDWYPDMATVMADLPGALLWLETMARLGFLRRNERWSGLLDELLDQRDATGIWHAPGGDSPPSMPNDPLSWPIYPIEARQSGEKCWTDVTFRLALIARLAGRTLETA